VPAGLAWLALAVAACRPCVHPSPDQVAVLNLNLASLGEGGVHGQIKFGIQAAVSAAVVN